MKNYELKFRIFVPVEVVSLPSFCRNSAGLKKDGVGLRNLPQQILASAFGIAYEMFPTAPFLLASFL